MKRRNDIILLVTVLLLSCAGILFVNYRKNSVKTDIAKAKVLMSVDGKVEQEIDLSKDGDYAIVNDNGDFNTINITQGVVRMKEANCPDKLCIHQGKISKNGETIVCLPHGLIVEIKSDDNPELDIVR
jgi:hypothetical protein